MINMKKGFINLGTIGTLLILIAIAVLISYFISTDKISLSAVGIDQGDFTYTQQYDSSPLNIGNNQFKASPLTYICGDTGESSVSYPDPREDCWRSEVTYEGKLYTLSGGNTAQISPSISVTLNPKGKVYFEDGKAYYRSSTSWKSTYIFKITRPDPLKTIITSKPDSILGQTNYIDLTIDNKIADFDTLHSGVYVRHEHNLLQKAEGWSDQGLSLKSGENKYSIMNDASELGGITTYVQAYVKIDADTEFVVREKSPVKVEYKITQDQILPESEKEPFFESEKKGWFRNLVDLIKRWFN